MVTREQLVEQSVEEWVKTQLFDVRGYPAAQIEVLDEFPFNTFEGPLEKNYIAAGFNFDDQGQQAELGSDLTKRMYTIEWYVFGKDGTWAQNIAHAVKFALETEKIIPLLNVSVAGKPQIDSLEVHGVQAEKVQVPQPEPSEKYVYRVNVRVQDEYFPSQAWYWVMALYPRAKGAPAEPSSDGRLWYIILGVPTHLIRCYELLLTASELSLARATWDPVAGAQSLAFDTIITQMRTRVDAIAAETASVAQDRAKELVRATAKRPAGSGRLESAVTASPVLIPGVTAHGLGAVGVGNVHILDGAVVNPYTGSDKGYWRAQEDGSGHLLGKTIPGVFQPGEAPPDPSMNREHPIFEARPYYPGIKYWMTIRHAIKGRHFLKNAAGEAYALRHTLLSALEAQIIAEVNEIDAGTHPLLGRYGGRR